MKFFLLRTVFILTLCALQLNCSSSQELQCCTGVKKVKIKKGKKSRKGTLRGAKGYDDKKALKQQAKAFKNKIKAKRKAFKESIKAENDSLELTRNPIKEQEEIVGEPIDSIQILDKLIQDERNSLKIEKNSINGQ